MISYKMSLTIHVLKQCHPVELVNSSVVAIIDLIAEGVGPALGWRGQQVAQTRLTVLTS